MFKFSQNRLLFQWPSRYVRTVYQKYRKNSGKNTEEKFRDCIPKIPVKFRKIPEKIPGKLRGKYRENAETVYRKYRESHRNHSGEQIVIHQGRKVWLCQGTKIGYYSRKRRKMCGLKINKNFSRGFLGDFYMFAVISRCVGVWVGVKILLLRTRRTKIANLSRSTNLWINVVIIIIIIKCKELKKSQN